MSSSGIGRCREFPGQRVREIWLSQQQIQKDPEEKLHTCWRVRDNQSYGNSCLDLMDPCPCTQDLIRCTVPRAASQGAGRTGDSGRPPTCKTWISEFYFQVFFFILQALTPFSILHALRVQTGGTQCECAISLTCRHISFSCHLSSYIVTASSKAIISVDACLFLTFSSY